MELVPLKSKLIVPGDSIVDQMLASSHSQRLQIRNRDIIAIASKAVATAEGRVVALNSFQPTPEATRLARLHRMEAQFVQAVIDEAEEVYGGVKGALLTLKNGDAVANSGVDQKNAPRASVVLWPRDPDLSARKLLGSFRRRTGKKIGVVIVDSRVSPLRLGTIGMAVACAGFKPVHDFRAEADLFGRRPRITRQASADGIAAAAQLVMGEGRERIPFVLVRGAPVVFDGFKAIPRIRSEDCLYMSLVTRAMS